jgi:rRNA-processing protein FCF1
VKSQPYTTVVLDTSFILSMLRNHREFDDGIRDSVRGPLRLATSDGVLMELQRLARSGDFQAAGLARVALSVLEKRGVLIQETDPSTPNVDTAILALALGDRGLVEVATSDRRLKHALYKLGVTAISPRKHGGLEVVPGAQVPLK